MAEIDMRIDHSMIMQRHAWRMSEPTGEIFECGLWGMASQKLVDDLKKKCEEEKLPYELVRIMYKEISFKSEDQRSVRLRKYNHSDVLRICELQSANTDDKVTVLKTNVYYVNKTEADAMFRTCNSKLSDEMHFSASLFEFENGALLRITAQGVAKGGAPQQQIPQGTDSKVELCVRCRDKDDIPAACALTRKMATFLRPLVPLYMVTKASLV